MRVLAVLSLLLLNGCLLTHIPFPRIRNNARSGREWFHAQIVFINNRLSPENIVVELRAKESQRLQCPLSRYSDMRDCEIVIRRGAQEALNILYEVDVRHGSNGEIISASSLEFEVRVRVITLPRVDYGSMPTGRVIKFTLTPTNSFGTNTHQVTIY